MLEGQEHWAVANWIRPDGWYEIDFKRCVDESELTRGVPPDAKGASKWVRMIMDDRYKFRVQNDNDESSDEG